MKVPELRDTEGVVVGCEIELLMTRGIELCGLAFKTRLETGLVSLVARSRYEEEFARLRDLFWKQQHAGGRQRSGQADSREAGSQCLNLNDQDQFASTPILLVWNGACGGL